MNMQEIRIIKGIIKKLRLNLKGLTVFTEAASGHYKWLPIIAGLAGAECVYAFAKSSRHATRKDVVKNVSRFACKLRLDQIQIVYSKSAICKADIVTNSGFVRPIDKKVIRLLKSTAVIPLMYEPWEYRKEDLDLKECRRKKIPVLGTNEEDCRIKILDYLGPLAQKMISQAGYALRSTGIAIFGADTFGKKIYTHLKKHYGNTRLYNEKQISTLLKRAAGIDVILLTRYVGANKNVFSKSLLKKLKQQNSKVVFIQLIGGSLDYQYARRIGFKVFPAREVRPMTMGWTLAEFGARPVIDLHAAGLKVGEVMARLRKKKISYAQVIRKASKNRIVKGF